MKTVRLALTGLALAFAAAASDAGPDADAALRTRVGELVEMMATGDAASRASAADELVKLGRPAVATVSRFAHLVRDAAGRDVVAGALTRIGLDDSIALVLAHPSYWPPAGDGAVRDLLASLRSRRDPKLATHVELTPAVATNAARVPPDAESEIGDALPEALAWGEFAVRKAKGAIQVDVEGGGARFETVSADRPRAVRVGPRKRPILVYWRFDRWFAASASLVAGRIRAEDVELWDADLDGSFAGPGDFLRLGDGAFQRIPADGLVHLASGLATMSVRATAGGASATFVPEPMPPDTGDWTLRALGVVNEWRRGVALPPALLNLVRVAACERHVDYWRKNGYSGHDETPDRPGWSAEGAQAGRRSSVWDTADAAKLARVITATVLHRASCLGAAGEGIGIAIGSGSCIWGGDLDARERGFPILVPGPGQDSVPPNCESEQPPPDRDPGFYARPRGYPVAVVWRGVWNDVRRATIELYSSGAGGAMDLVPGELFDPDHPFTAKGRQIETGAATFVATAPLDRRRAYLARFRAARDGGPVEVTWSFSTR